MYVPSQMFLVKGVGKAKAKLSSFEAALRAAGIEKYNLVRVSSIIPPNCRIISPQQGLKQLQPGQIVHCVISENSSNEPNRLMVASIGIAIPKNNGQYGYLAEHHGFGQRERVAGDYAEDLAAEMLASCLGLEFDPEKDWDEKKEIFRVSGKIIRTSNITQSAVGDRNGLWTTVLAAAVFLP